VFSKAFLDLLIQIITSWQVIAVTVVLVLYTLLVSYVGRLYRPRRRRPKRISLESKPKKAASSGPAEEEASSPEDDILGEE
jgi:hypothetical protein